MSKVSKEEHLEGPKVSKQLSLIDDPDIDYHALSEKHGFSAEDGRLVLDPAEARVYYVSSCPDTDLKLPIGGIWF